LAFGEKKCEQVPDPVFMEGDTLDKIEKVGAFTEARFLPLHQSNATS
jgi:hypothetical protein